MPQSPSPCLLRSLRSTDFIRSTRPVFSTPKTSQYSPRPLQLHPRGHGLHLRNAIHTTTRLTLSAPLSHQFPAAAASVPRTTDRGPPSSETTQTDFPTMDMLSVAPPPAAAIDNCLPSSFHLSNGVKVHDAGVFIIAGEAFAWTPWASSPHSSTTRPNSKSLTLFNKSHQFAPPPAHDPWALLEIVYPKPDILVLGVGPQMMPLASETRAAIADLGVRVEVQDTRNAAAQFNLLATERGVSAIAVAAVPLGWREGKGLVG